VNATTAPLAGIAAGAVDAEAVLDGFIAWSAGRGMPLYPAQEEAVLALVSGEHVVLSTPTGTGKSLVAAAAHLAALAEGRRSVYTAPIKALVSEKFFALVELFGAENVGMMTGDSAVNADAPILCCTAEILANLALRQGPEAPADLVIMDEFHFYGEPERGWAWQVPLLVLERSQFLLLSATLGDVTWLREDLERRTGRGVTLVTGVDRPVPLHFRWALTPVHETVEELLETREAPVYVVHFAQAAAAERAQALLSAKVATREQRDRIAEAIAGFRFGPGFGQILSKLIRAGIGVHHAGMLPKYRRLVEQLAQQGLLRVICGTDTLGVGINVPIRTVLFTALTKFDGQRMRRLNAREFHQIAGRAGRAGFDTAGTVVAQAPDHEVENARLVAKAGDDPKKLKRVQRKKAPEGFVSWSEATFEKLQGAEPEALTSRMTISHAMLLNIIARGGDVVANVRRVVEGNHEPRRRQLALARRAIELYRSLRAAGVVEQVPDGEGGTLIRLTVDLQPNFALNQPLSPLAYAAFELLDPESPTYALDMVSIVEATLDDPRAILSQQEFKARGEAVAAMKSEGIEYEERMALLDEVSYPKPLEELLTAAYEEFKAVQPWVGDYAIGPKSVVRDMVERAMNFSQYVQYYQLARSEGLVLRYLTDAYRTMRQTIPEDAKTEPLHELIDWLGELVRQVDSSLLDEWEQLANPGESGPERTEAVPPTPRGVTGNVRAFRVLVRNELFRRVILLARDDVQALGALDGAEGFHADAWNAFLDGYEAEYDAPVPDGPAARGPGLLLLDEGRDRWTARQVIDDPAGDRDWGFSAEVDLAASDEQGVAVVRLTALGRL
jgi:superfamily II RNA helicase